VAGDARVPSCKQPPLIGVEIHVDEKIATQEVAAQQQRVLHPLTIVECNQHFLLDVLPPQVEPHLVALVVVRRRANRHVVDNLRVDPFLFAVRIPDENPNALADVVVGVLGGVLDLDRFVMDRAGGSTGVDAGGEGEAAADLGDGRDRADVADRGLADLGRHGIRDVRTLVGALQADGE